MALSTLASGFKTAIDLYNSLNFLSSTQRPLTYTNERSYHVVNNSAHAILLLSQFIPILNSKDNTGTKIMYKDGIVHIQPKSWWQSVERTAQNQSHDDLCFKDIVVSQLSWYDIEQCESLKLICMTSRNALKILANNYKDQSITYDNLNGLIDFLEKYIKNEIVRTVPKTRYEQELFQLINAQNIKDIALRLFPNLGPKDSKHDISGLKYCDSYDLQQTLMPFIEKSKTITCLAVGKLVYAIHSDAKEIPATIIPNTLVINEIAVDPLALSVFLSFFYDLDQGAKLSLKKGEFKYQLPGLTQPLERTINKDKRDDLNTIAPAILSLLNLHNLNDPRICKILLRTAMGLLDGLRETYRDFKDKEQFFSFLVIKIFNAAIYKIRPCEREPNFTPYEGYFHNAAKNLWSDKDINDLYLSLKLNDVDISHLLNMHKKVEKKETIVALPPCPKAAPPRKRNKRIKYRKNKSHSFPSIESNKSVSTTTSRPASAPSSDEQKEQELPKGFQDIYSISALALPKFPKLTQDGISVIANEILMSHNKSFRTKAIEAVDRLLKGTYADFK